MVYRGKIWGMCQERCNRTPTVNKALRVVMGSIETDKSVAVVAIWRELYVTLCTCCPPAKSAQAIKKYPTYDILECPLRTNKPAWAELLNM